MKNLTKKEQNEYPFITLGRLRIAIEMGDTERALTLLEKVTEDMSDLDIKVMHSEKETINVGDENYNLEVPISYIGTNIKEDGIPF